MSNNLHGIQRDPHSGALVFLADPMEKKIAQLVKRVDDLVKKIDELERQYQSKETST